MTGVVWVEQALQPTLQAKSQRQHDARRSARPTPASTQDGWHLRATAPAPLAPAHASGKIVAATQRAQERASHPESRQDG